MNVDVEYKEIEKTIAEDEFKRQKLDEYKKKFGDKSAPDSKTNKDKPNENAEPSGSNTNNTDNEYDEQIGIAGMIAEVWNDVGVKRGYDEISEKEITFLNKHSAKLERKMLDLKLTPEIDAALSHIVVYAPKWIKHHNETNQDKPKNKKR